MPFRQAHEVVGAMVRQLLADGRDIEALTLAEWQAFSPLFADDVQGARDGAGLGARPAGRRSPPTRTRSAARLAELRAWLGRRPDAPSRPAFARGRGLC